MFDISRLLPGFNSRTTVVQTPATWAPLIPASPDRPILYITNNSTTQQLYLQFGSVVLGQAGNIVVNPNSTLAFTWMLDGPMSTYAWYGASQAGTTSIWITEVFWYPRQLGA